MGCGLSHTQKHDRETKSALSPMTENVEQSLQRFGFKSFTSDVHERPEIDPWSEPDETDTAKFDKRGNTTTKVTPYTDLFNKSRLNFPFLDFQC